MRETERGWCSGFHLTLPFLTVIPEGRKADVMSVQLSFFFLCSICQWEMQPTLHLSISIPLILPLSTLHSLFVSLNLFLTLLYHQPHPHPSFPSSPSVYFSRSSSTLHLSFCMVGGCVGTSVGVTSAAAAEHRHSLKLQLPGFACRVLWVWEREWCHVVCKLPQYNSKDNSGLLQLG